ncbi:hypothetical protein MED297_07306 [Reinekea sp. MED297]|uniref:Co-chaperone DjlA N-terminal domain-containing protein n=2 Tax=Reinekea TaxID=230494 RepID=A4BKQ1_9GAMM|nr:hypothetical protein MED297_07306 [Reinekea sp. MED297] [Reinekea blandensis MED297]
MHIIIGFLTALASVLYGLERLGIDIGWINPWAWNRKRKWLKQFNANPAFSIKNPLEAVALLMTAVAKADGDMSADEKSKLLTLFTVKLKQSEEEASSLLGSCVYLLNQNDEILVNPEKVLTLCLPEFTEAQKSSTVDLLDSIANVAGHPTSTQKQFIERVKNSLYPEAETASEWG